MNILKTKNFIYTNVYVFIVVKYTKFLVLYMQKAQSSFIKSIINIKFTKMKKAVYLFMSVLALTSIMSCSKDDDGNDGGKGDDGSGITGKWYYYQEGYVSDSGSETLSDYGHSSCGNDYIDLQSNGTLKEEYFYDDGFGCESEIDDSGTWTKKGDKFSISYDGEVYLLGDIVTFDSSTLKIRYTEAGTAQILVFKRTLNGNGGGGGFEAFAGSWDGTYTGDDNGIFSVTISSNGSISGNGYSNNWEEGFSLNGSVNADGSFNAGNTSTGASFTGTIVGSNLTGNWNNPATNESGTFTGSKQ